LLEAISQGADVLHIFGFISALLSVCAFIFYIKNIFTSETRPQRASWLIWSVLSSIAFGSQIYEGATISLWFAGIQVAGTITVFLLSIRRGQGAFCTGSDAGVLVLAAGGIVLWALTDTAVYALAITISVSLLGGVVTVRKAYQHPATETFSTWMICCIASWCAILSVGEANWILLAYPVYLFILNGAIVMAIMLGREMRQGTGMIAAE